MIMNSMSRDSCRFFLVKTQIVMIQTNIFVNYLKNRLLFLATCSSVNAVIIKNNGKIELINSKYFRYVQNVCTLKYEIENWD